MSAVRQSVGETEFSTITVELNDDDPDEFPVVEVTLSTHFPRLDEARCITLTMAEARQLICGLASVIR